jgi:hypothetical protein
MPTGVLLAGEIGRLTAASGNAASNDKIPGFDTSTGKIIYFTPDQIASGASAVDGPASSTDNAFARFDSITGKLLQNSSSQLDDSGNADFAGTVTQITGKTDFQKFIGINDVLRLSVGTWTITRVAQGNYVYRKTATNETAIIGIDITEDIRTTATKGFGLVSFDYIFRNTTEALDAHSVTLDKLSYTDSEVVTVTSVGLTGALGTGVDADPQIDNVAINSLAFNNTANSKYVIEVTVDAAATSVYDFIGIVLKFVRNDL